MNSSPTVNSLPLGFFGAAWSGCLPAHTPESPCLGRAWRCVDTPSARHPWPSYRVFCPPRLDADTRPSCVALQEDVFVGGGFLLAAVVLFLLGLILWTLAAAFAASIVRRDRQRVSAHWSPQTRVALGGLRGRVRPVSDRQVALNPALACGWVTPMHALHRLQGVGLLIDQDEEELISALRRCLCGAAANLPLPGFPSCVRSGGYLFS